MNHSPQRSDDPVWQEAWQRIKSITFGAELIVSVFTDDEPAILVVEANGNVIWADHYAAVGTGSPIASAFLHQRDYHDTMEVDQCLYRVLEAKTAAEKNPYVGKATSLEVWSLDGLYDVSADYQRVLTDIITERRQIPELQFEPSHLRPFGYPYLDTSKPQV